MSENRVMRGRFFGVGSREKTGVQWVNRCLDGFGLKNGRKTGERGEVWGKRGMADGPKPDNSLFVSV